MQNKGWIYVLFMWVGLISMLMLLTKCQRDSTLTGLVDTVYIYETNTAGSGEFTVSVERVSPETCVPQEVKIYRDSLLIDLLPKSTKRSYHVDAGCEFCTEYVATCTAPFTIRKCVTVTKDTSIYPYN